MDEYYKRLVDGPPFVDHEEMRFEFVRLQTFRSWPASVSIPATKLCKEGFFYLGNEDEVTCFSCRGRIKEWPRVLSVPIFDIHKQKFPRCDFANGRDILNVPISGRPANARQNQTAPPPSSPRYEREPPAFASLPPIRGGLLGGNPSNVGLLQSDSSSGRRISDPQRSREPLRISPDSVQIPVGSDLIGPPWVPPGQNIDEDLRRFLFGQTTDFGQNIDDTVIWEHMKIEEARLRTFDTGWTLHFLQPADLARAGFFYKGSNDRTQCAFCRGILRRWEEGDSPMDEHRRHFPRCPLVLGQPCGNVPLGQTPDASFQDTRSRDQNQRSTTNTQSAELALGINTARPKHPEYAMESERTKSFTHWPTTNQQTPEILVAAGFFYAGFGDNVKCFFCNGGLRNWEDGDDPWEEHAKWFPKCAYLLQCKGRDYIARIQTEIQALGATGGSQLPVADGPDVLTLTKDMKSLGVQTVLPDIYEVMATQMVKEVIEIVNENAVKKAILKQRKENGKDFQLQMALIEAALLMNETLEGGQNVADSGATAAEYHTEDPPTDKRTAVKRPSLEDPELVKNENKRLREDRLCKICLDREMEAVFLPCGHLCACVPCATAMGNCPVCRINVKGTVRVFFEEK